MYVLLCLEDVACMLLKFHSEDIKFVPFIFALIPRIEQFGFDLYLTNALPNTEML